MSATHSPSQSISYGNAEAAPAVPSVEIDASCRAPLLFLFVSAAVWLFAGSVLAMVATLKFHQPYLLANHSFLTYGRVHPAHLNALIYGFAAQAGLGVLLWIIARLGRTRLAMAPAVLGGGLLLNLGVLLGILGILFGDSTGYEWLEMPRYASLVFFIGYLAIGLSAITTFHQRNQRDIYISHWFLIAAVFWFPWIFSTATYLLVIKPVRGVLQASLDWWYMNNLSTVWFGCIGLGAIFYFIPKVTKRPLYSHSLGLFAFWSVVIFGSWIGLSPGAPLPAWMPALSTVAAVLTVVPTLSVAWNIRQTAKGVDCSQINDRAAFKFICFGTMAFITAGLIGPIVSLRRFNEITSFTWFVPAQAQWVMYGFFAMTMFGAIYFILPRVTGIEFCSQKLIRLHFWFAALGIILYALPLALGGIRQGMAMNDRDKSFVEIMAGSLMYLRISTTGDLLMAAAHIVFLLNLGGMLNKLRIQCTASILGTDVKPAGVTS